MYGHAVSQIARKEFLQHFRTKRLFVVATLLAAVMALATVVGPTLFVKDVEDRSGTDDQSGALAEFQPNMVLLFYLGAPIIGGYMFLQLVAIVLTSDSVCSEWQNRTIFLLLSKPVPRSAFLLGKFVGTVGALWVVTVVVVGGDYVAMVALLPHGMAGDALGFVGALGVLLLGTAAFAAFSLFTSTLTRSAIMSTLMGLGAWLFIFPVLGSVGFFIAITDEGFRTEGEYDWQAVEDACGPDPHWFFDGQRTAAERQAEVAAYEACSAPFDAAYEQYYIDRGLEPFDAEARQAECAAMEETESEEYQRTQQNMTDAQRADFFENRPSAACYDAFWHDQDDQERQRRAILVAKYDSPRVDWSRYLSPSSTMSVADDLLRGDREPGAFDEIALSPQTIVAGADATPVHPVLALVAMVAFTALFLGAGALVIKRRDFE